MHVRLSECPCVDRHIYVCWYLCMSRYVRRYVGRYVSESRYIRKFVGRYTFLHVCVSFGPYVWMCACR